MDNEKLIIDQLLCKRMRSLLKVCDDSEELKPVKESIKAYLDNVDKYSIKHIQVKNITNREQSYFRLFVERSIDKEFDPVGCRAFIEQCDRMQEFRNSHESYVLARKEYEEASEKDYIIDKNRWWVVDTRYSEPFRDKWLSESERIDKLFPEELLPDNQFSVSKKYADFDYFQKEFESAYVALVRRKSEVGMDALYKESREQIRRQILKVFYDKNKEKLEPKYNN